MREATSAQRNELRKLAHHLEPVVQIGKRGLSDEVIMATVDALEAHELIKVKLLAFKEDRKSLVRDLADKADCTLAGVIGHVVILYREPPDNEKRKIKLESS